jgi:hypothetical protein
MKLIIHLLALFSPCFMLVCCLAYSFTLKVAEICSSDVDIQRATWRYVQKDRNLHTVKVVLFLHVDTGAHCYSTRHAIFHSLKIMRADHRGRAV